MVQTYPGESAILDGADPATFTWAPQGSGVYHTTVNAPDPHVVLADGQRLFPYEDLTNLQNLSRDNTPGFLADGTSLYVHLAGDANPNAATMEVSRYNHAFTVEQDYVYFLTEPMGKNFDPAFKPELTPKQMLALGVFGGKYLTDFVDEFPKDWFEKAKLSPEGKDVELNYFKIDASKPLSYWEQKEWIHPDDPRGWFQWYCRYYLGRRGKDDERQIKRWKAMKRHIAQIEQNCPKRDLQCRRKQRQALLHWAYDSRKM